MLILDSCFLILQCSTATILLLDLWPRSTAMAIAESEVIAENEAEIKYRRIRFRRRGGVGWLGQKQR